MRFVLKIPNKFKHAYTATQTMQNYNKVLIAGLIVLLVQILAVVSNLIDPFTSHQLILKHYLKFYYYCIGGHIVFLLLAYIIYRKELGTSLKRIFVHCYTYYIIFWAAGVAVADQFQGEEIVVYYTMVFILAIVLDIDTITFFVIVAANHVMFLLLLTIYERFYSTVFGLRAGSTQIITFIILLRYYLHELVKKNFIHKETLKESANKLKHLEMTDPVTGLNSRYHWESLYRQAYEMAANQGRSFGLCLIDIDEFSKYNKVHGHEKGDAILRAAGRVVKQTCDQFNGVSTRYSGDAFIVYFMDIGQDELVALCDLIAQRMKALSSENTKSEHQDVLTVSTGIYYNTRVLKESLWDFIYAVEKSLSRNKRGKDK